MKKVVVNGELRRRFVGRFSLVLCDEATPATDDLIDRMATESAAVPGLWFVEITNVLAIAERKGRIDEAKVAEFIDMILGFDLDIDGEIGRRAFTDILPICRSDQLTSYDAVYLELALRRSLPLATLDEPLRKAAAVRGVQLLGT